MTIVATWYGTAALHLVVDDSLGVFFDPSFERPPNAQPKIAADPKTVKLDPLDVVLVSHSHFDHVYNLPDLVRRYPAVHAYAPAMTVENCRRLCNGAIFKDYVCECSESDWERVHTVKAGDHIEITSQDGRVRLRAVAIESGHVRLDAYSILRVLFNYKVICRLGHYAKYLVGFPREEVLGWELQVESAGESKRIVFFGSLCDRHRDVLLQHSGCDWLILPLAGRKDILPCAAIVTEAMRPRAVIPVHHDDFFPPISYPVDYRNYSQWLKRSLPETRLIELEPEVPTRLLT